MKKYIFSAKSKQDINKIALATLWRVHSNTVVPKVLTNNHFNTLVSLTMGTIFLCQIQLSQQQFKKYVHNKNYDLGLFFCKINGQDVVIVIDGTGCFASTHTVNIFLDYFAQNKNQLKTSKQKLKNLYKPQKNIKKMADMRF